MRFKRAIEKALPGAYQPGLQALERPHRKRISCRQTRSLAGSVDIDSALKRAHPNDHRWDYGIGVDRGDGTHRVVWVEVHSASSTHVAEVIKKVHWLKAWLKKHPELSGMTTSDGYVWVATDRVIIQSHSPQAKRLAAAGLQLRERLEL